MNKKRIVLISLCCLALAACSNQSGPYLSEARPKTVDARAGQDFAQYAVYNPIISADAGIEVEDVEFAAGTGTYRLMNPTVET